MTTRKNLKNGTAFLPALKLSAFKGVVAEGTARRDVIQAIRVAKDSDEMKSFIRCARIVVGLSDTWKLNTLDADKCDVSALIARAASVYAKKPHKPEEWAKAKKRGPKALEALAATMRSAEEAQACRNAATYLTQVREDAGLKDKPTRKPRPTKTTTPEADKPATGAPAPKLMEDPTPAMSPTLHNPKEVAEWAKRRAALLRIDLQKNAKHIPVAVRTLTQDYIKALEASFADK